MMVTLLCLVALAAGLYTGWRVRGSYETTRPYPKIELAGCPKCRTLYVGPDPRQHACVVCGTPMKFQYVMMGERITPERPSNGQG